MFANRGLDRLARRGSAHDDRDAQDPLGEASEMATVRTKRAAALGLIGLGAGFTTVAVLIPTYAAPKLVKTPLSIDAPTVATDNNATLLDMGAIDTGKVVINSGVAVTVQQYVTGEEPSNSDIVTIQSTQKVTRDDREGAAAVVSANVYRVTVDRATALPVQDPPATIQRYADKPGEEVVAEGVNFKFPFHLQKQSYPYFDTLARETYPIDFVETTQIDGTEVFHFSHTIDPMDTGGKLTLPASVWGLSGDPDAQVLMHRFYTAKRDLWVEPVTGAIVAGNQYARQYYARTADDPESVTIVEMAPALDAQTKSEQLAQAVRYKRLIVWGTQYAPMGLGAVGVIALLGGAAMLWRNRQIDSTAGSDVQVAAPHEDYDRISTATH